MWQWMLIILIIVKYESRINRSATESSRMGQWWEGVSLVSEGQWMSIFLFSTNICFLFGRRHQPLYIYSHNKTINPLPNNTPCVLLGTWGMYFLFWEKNHSVKCLLWVLVSPFSTHLCFLFPILVGRFCLLMTRAAFY